MSKNNEKYAGQIRLLIPINELSPQSQDEIVQKSEITELKKDKFLFKQGDRDDYSYYLLEGEIELLANDQLHNTITGGSERACYAMAQLQPRQFSARSKTPCVIFKVNRNILDKYMVLAEKKPDDAGSDDFDSTGGEMEVSDIESEDDIDWMTRMLQSELFARIPMANMHHVFAVLEPVEYSAGDTVVSQGEAGEHYYIIAEGKCIVSRRPKEKAESIKLAELGPGDSFGEEALIMDSTRNATVTMATDGILMQLSKDNFNKLIKEPTLNAVRYDEAQDLIYKGACWLDVRYPGEYSESHIKGSINIPLNLLRMQSEKIDKDREYIVYCDTGGRSSTAAFLLIERGYNVRYLQGGLISNPNIATEASREQSTPAQAADEKPPSAVNKPATPAKSTAAPASQPAKTQPEPEPEASQPEPQPEQPQPAPKPAPVADSAAPPAAKTPATQTATAKSSTPEAEKQIEETGDMEITDPNIKTSYIETELERTNIKLRDIEKIREEVAEVERQKQEQAIKELEKERSDLEQQRKAAQKEAEKLRLEEEKRIEKLKKDSEKKLSEEKKKLEAIYNKNTSEMEKINKLKKELEEKEARARAELEKENEKALKMKQEAEEMARREKEKLEQESIEARRMLDEARRMKEEIEAARKSIEQESQANKAEQQKKEKELQEKVKIKLEAERRKLAEQLAKNNMDLEQAQKERAAAEAARKAAHEEAQRIIEEYKREHEKTRMVEEEKLRQEREKLEREANQLKEQMEAIRQDKQKAEQEKLEAQKQIAMLKIKSVQSKDKDEETRQTISEQIRQVEAKISEADKQIEEVENAEKQAVEAVYINQADLDRQSEEEKRLQQQLQEDLHEFIAEHEEQTRKAGEKLSTNDYMKRINERAEAARQQAARATESLFADVASMLDDDDK